MGELLRGTGLLQTAVARLRADGWEGYRRLLSGELAEGFLKASEPALAHTTICEAVEQEQVYGPSCHMPELLRVKGEILISMSQSDSEQCLLDSLSLARDQRALSFELRAGMSLARLWAATGRRDNALDFLSSIYSRFSEGSRPWIWYRPQGYSMSFARPPPVAADPRSVTVQRTASIDEQCWTVAKR